MKARRVLCIGCLRPCWHLLRYRRPQTSISEWQVSAELDTAIVEELIARFMQPNVKGIKVTYEHTRRI